MIHIRRLSLIIFTFSLLPLNAQNVDSSLIGRSPYDVADSLMFGWIPVYQHDSIPPYTGSSIFTTEYQPSGSYWDEDCDEEDVFLARLIHKEADSVHWDLGVGRAGIIYSFIGPYGEGVPPQVHNSSGLNLAPWIDEVWQIVSVNTTLNNNDRLPAPPGSSLATTVRSMPYFIHGAGAYRNDTMYASGQAPFYSPLMASWYNQQEKALYTTNWGTQAHIPSLHKSQLLYTYKYKDLGNGIMENTMVIQNFGEDQVHYHNMPWGGVRASNLPQVWFSNPDHSLERSYKTFGGDDQGIVGSLDLTGGYMIWAADGDNEDRPALAIVYGYEKHKAEFKDKYNMGFNRIRWGLTGNVDRSYTVFVLNPKIDVNRGNSFYYRVYYINGTMKEVHEKARKIADAADYGFIDADPGQADQVVIKAADHFDALKEDIRLYAEPVPDNVPLFLMENTLTGTRYISPDLYHDVPTLPFVNPYDPADPKYETYQDRFVYRQYDGTIKYIRLLGYGVSSRGNTPDIRFTLLDSLVLDSTRVIIPDAYKRSIWLPLGSCDNCSYGLDPEPLPAGHVLYSDFGENRNYRAREPENMDYSHNVQNPSQTSANTSRLTGKVIRQEGTESSLFFEVPGSIDLSGHGTFRLRVYHETNDPIGNPCNIGLILRDSGKRDTQYDLWQEIEVSNKWTEFTFDCSFAEQIGSYNQVWLYFSSPDDENQAAGQTVYIDELTGPPLLVPIKEYSVIFQVQDQLTDAPLQGVRVIMGQEEQLTDASGEARFKLSEGEYSYRVSHPDYESLDSSFMLFKDTTVRVPMALRPKAVIFSISSDKTGNALAKIPVIVGEKEVQTGVNGEAIFDLSSGTYTFSINHPDYFTTSSTIEITKDTTIQLILIENKANIKFKVYSEDKPLYNATVELNENSLNTSQTGIVLFQDLTRFMEYAWSASREGYEEVAGLVSLMNDTTVNLSMKLLSYMGDYGSPGLTLYPNPVHSKLFIESEEAISWIEICDLRAAVIELLEVYDYNATIDMANYPEGLYIAKIYRDGLRTLSLKVIKSE